jgi:hypothetical protein
VLTFGKAEPDAESHWGPNSAGFTKWRSGTNGLEQSQLSSMRMIELIDAGRSWRSKKHISSINNFIARNIRKECNSEANRRKLDENNRLR